MSTVATPTIEHFAAEWAKLYPSAQCSGIVGNREHQLAGGYHIGRSFQPPTNYSVVRPQDRVGPGDAASAIDMSMNRHDMMVCTHRLEVAYKNKADPRRKYLNGFNGWRGSGSATRFDFVTMRTQFASADHKWHIHLEYRRAFVNSKVATAAVLSILAGQSVAAYLQSVGVTMPVAPKKPLSGQPALPAFPGRILRRDDAMRPDPAVARWQARMIKRGWTSVGVADGLFGVKTQICVRKFQASCKVPVDGEIGPVTWALPWTRPIGR